MMKTVGQIASFALLLTLTFLALGCGAETNPKIVYLIHQDNGSFGSTILAEFQRVAAERGREVEVFDGENDADTQIRQLAEAVQRGEKLIILAAVDEEKLVEPVKEATLHGATVVPINRHLRWNGIPGIFPDEYGAGKLQAECMTKLLPKDAKVFYLQGTASQYSAACRYEGFNDECLKRRRDIKIVERRDGSYSREAGYRIMTEWLARYDKIDGVVCGNDDMALDAVQALKEAGRLTGCLVSGIDATPEAIKAVASGDMVQTIKQDATHQAAGAFQLADERSRGVTKPGNILVPFVSITKENMGRYLDNGGENEIGRILTKAHAWHRLLWEKGDARTRMKNPRPPSLHRPYRFHFLFATVHGFVGAFEHVVHAAVNGRVIDSVAQGCRNALPRL